MIEEPDHSDPHESGLPPEGSGPSQQFKHTPVSARVPEKVRCGVFATGSMILQTGDEFVVDFLSTMVPPQQIVSRVVMNATTFGGTVPVLQASIAKYEAQFGKLKTREGSVTPPPIPSDLGGPVWAEQGTQHHEQPGQTPAPAPTVPENAPPHVERVYDDLKFPDELLGGSYANAVMIRHTADEFCFDFITNFYPRSAVTSRVYLAVGRVPPLFEAMASALKKYQRRAIDPPGQSG